MYRHVTDILLHTCAYTIVHINNYACTSHVGEDNLRNQQWALLQVVKSQYDPKNVIVRLIYTCRCS